MSEASSGGVGAGAGPVPGTGPVSVGWRDKSLWAAGDPLPAEAFVSEEHGLFDGSVSWPAMVLRERALAANLDALAGFAEGHGMLFAPHGKTTMAPQLFARQLEAGAWGVTVATPFQASVALRAGVQRVLIANEVLDRPALAAVARLRDEPDGPAPAGAEVLCLVDSPEGVAVAEAGRGDGEMPVLIDFGYPGGRTGVRSEAEAIELGRIIAATDGVRLVGISCFEGMLPDAQAVRELLARLRGTAEALLAEGLLEAGRAFVSAGGSAFFDIVAEQLDAEWAQRAGVRVILRSGVYLAHDHGMYERTTPFTRMPGELRAAVELWTQVVSAPEPGRAYVALGKRDTSFDAGMPVPLRLRRARRGRDAAVGAGNGAAAAAASAEAAWSEPVGIRGAVELTRMDDQHGYLETPEGFDVRPGDLVCLGVSHPCTTFDRWRSILVVDDDDRIVDVVRTYF